MHMAEFTPLTPKVVLAVGAHADDIDFGASGTVAKWAHDGAEVHYLVITDGSKGSADRTMTSEKLIAVREQEQRDAVAALGAKEAHFLRYEDSMLEVTMALKKDIVRIIRQIRPDTVIVMDPTMVYLSELNFINHPDHRAAGQATLDAVFPLARDHLSFPDLCQDEKLEPHKVGHVLLINLETHNYYVDITNTIELKLEGLKRHVSQMADVTVMQDFIRQRAEVLGSHTGTKYAEGFVRIDTQA
jgi:LmbE family N-acetylglucosaminyl deacetylase